MREIEKSYEELLEAVTQLQREGKLPARPTRAQIADWAYGNTKIENDSVTREMAETAVDEIYGSGT